MGIENIDPVEIKTSAIKKADWNYKENDEEMAAKLAENIRRNGIMQVSIIYEDTDGQLVVLDGNHRLDAYRLLKIKKVPCVNMGKITLAEAQRIAIELNETRFENDTIRLVRAMKTINEEFSIEDMEKTLGFPAEDIKAMVELDESELAEVADTDADTDGGGGADGHLVKCPKCGKEFVRGKQ